MTSPLLVAVLLSATAPALPKIAVMDVVVRAGVPTSVASVLSDGIVAEVRRRRARSQVISADEIRAMLQVVGERQKLGCRGDKDVACIAEIGGALGADQMVTGTLGKLGRTYVFSLKLIDVSRARVLRSASVNLKTHEDDELLASATNLVAQLFPDVQAPLLTPVIAPTPEAPVVPEAAVAAPVATPPSRHSHVPAILIGVAGLAAGAVAIYGLTQVLAYNSDVAAVNQAPRGTYPYDKFSKAQASAQLWQPLGIGLGVLGLAGVTTAVITW